ncbi:MAG: membrane protein insertase YidC [Candidatus Magasanikbacteria bacterium]|jgi:YidC/Oxa1 family membrane protein insertase|nr:membrane protein insertase YidC [Candidatus Magasanikbacteria bacterium]MBT4315112.1 membrane protein insertase YidC [Candidatus Magasanikbacteria bacterium]MBT4547432.1 membrane protein insertase YidC [Candidatus Magasanikbacteria bacterium]MBT6819327.1 membrane protein insertase YidC [Candidatus Magasanikbacteria bacterium]
MAALFQTVLFQPLFNLFIGLYNLIPDVGIVILILTALIKLVLYPLTSASIKSQKALTDLQPKLDELKKKHKDDQQKVAQETMKMYKENKVNPFASCLPLLIQLPILIALYWVLRQVLTADNFDTLYSFVANPGHINTISLGFIELGKASYVLALLAGGAQFWQAKMMTRKKPPANAGPGAKDEGMATMMNKQMLYMMPVLTVIIGMKLPGGLTLYWFLSTLFMALQQLVVFKKKKKLEGGKKEGNVIEGKIVK